MDTVTHGLAGSMLARSLVPRPGARAALLLGLVASMLPDLDILFLKGRLDYLANHRGWSHSFLVLPFFALALALPARLLWPKARLATLWLFAAAGIGSHILFDWITSFGTMFFFPLSRARYSLDWVFILDPIFTGIAAAALLASLIFRARGRRIAACGGAALLLYVAFCAVQHQRALSVWRRLDRPPAGTRVAALPQLLSPFRWLGLADHADSVHVCFFDIGPFARGVGSPRAPERFRDVFRSLSGSYPPPEGAVIQSFPKPPPSETLEAARALPDVEVYLAFARFPLATVRPETLGGSDVTFEDLRFLPWFAGPWGRNPGRGFGREAFVYRVIFDRGLRPVERGFVRKGRLR